jgi:periplasmic divalent cation tolerance protein
MGRSDADYVIRAAGPEHSSFEPSDTADTSAHLSTLFARPETHGSGVSQGLHDSLLTELAARGFTTVRLWVPAGADQACRFYIRNKWEETGRFTTFAGLERVEMRRPVSGVRQTIVEVKTRVPDRETAEKIAEAVVAEQLATCAHVSGPIDSWYWWKGNVETAQEWEVDAVTTVVMSDRCSARIRGMHPYQLPALLVTELTASAEYVSWVQVNTC